MKNGFPNNNFSDKLNKTLLLLEMDTFRKKVIARGFDKDIIQAQNHFLGRNLGL